MYLNTPWEQHYENLDGRTILDRLASVKYFVVKNNRYQYMPYGYYWLEEARTKTEKYMRPLEVKRLFLWGILTIPLYPERNMKK